MNCERVSFMNAAELRSWWNILKKLNSLCIYNYTSILFSSRLGLRHLSLADLSIPFSARHIISVAIWVWSRLWDTWINELTLIIQLNRFVRSEIISERNFRATLIYFSNLALRLLNTSSNVSALGEPGTSGVFFPFLLAVVIAQWAFLRLAQWLSYLFIPKSISKIDKQILIASARLTVRDSGQFQFLSQCEITTIAGCMSRMSQSVICWMYPNNTFCLFSRDPLKLYLWSLTFFSKIQKIVPRQLRKNKIKTTL